MTYAIPKATTNFWNFQHKGTKVRNDTSDDIKLTAHKITELRGATAHRSVTSHGATKLASSAATRKLRDTKLKWLQLRACPRKHRAVVLHAISLISVKLCQFKGFTPKLQKTNWFLFWFFPGGDRPPSRFFLVFTKEIVSK